MAMNSINTNTGAMIALQSLAKTQTELATTQNRISSGLKIGSAKDNGAIWAISQVEKAQATSLDTVTNSLNNGKSVVDAALQAGDQLTSILTQMCAKALAASDATIDDASRAQYQGEFAKLGQAYANTIASATFNGVNLIDGGTGSVSALGSADGAITVKSAHLKLDMNTIGSTLTAFTVATPGAAVGSNSYFSADLISAPTAAGTGWTGAGGAGHAAADLATVDTMMTTLTKGLSGFGVDSKAMDSQLSVVSQMQDSLNTGVGNLVDANLAKESANLQALQTKQQLGVQALSIANQSSGILLSLFR